MNYFQGTYP